MKGFYFLSGLDAQKYKNEVKSAVLVSVEYGKKLLALIQMEILSF